MIYACDNEDGMVYNTNHSKLVNYKTRNLEIIISAKRLLDTRQMENRPDEKLPKSVSGAG